MFLKRLAIVFICFLAFSSIAYGEDLYVAQTAAGGDTGANCANAHSATWFNTAANWGGGVGEIDPGDTVHICGTWTQTGTPPLAALLTIQTSGTAGNVITILFEDGAVLQGTAFGEGGAITIDGKNYIKIDGGTNGIIQNTDNGSVASGKTYHVGTGGTYHTADDTDSSEGIHMENVNYIEICNLTIKDIYINTGGGTAGTTEATGMQTKNIHLSNDDGNSTNINIHDNTLSNSRAGIYIDFEGRTFDTINIYDNIINDHAWSIVAGAGSNDSRLTNIDIHGNELSDWHLWQCPSVGFCDDGLSAYAAGTTYQIGDKVSYGGAPWKALAVNTGRTPAENAYWEGGDHYHTDGLIIYSNTGASTSYYTGKFRDNYVHGNLGGGSPSGFVGSGCGGQNFLIANNLFVCDNEAGGEARGSCIVDYNAGTTGCTAGQPLNTTLYNNTIIGTATQASGQAGHAIKAARAGIYMTVKNNIFVSYYVPLYDMNTDLSGFSGANGSANYNLYYGHTYAAAFSDGGTKVSLATFKSTYSQEANSVAADPSIDGSYKPDAVGDPIVAAGADLTSLGISTDKDGNARPSGSAWTIGAYEWGAAADTDTPDLVLMTINVSGTTATLVLDENVTVNDGTGFTLDCNGGVGEGLSFVSESLGTITFNITGRAIDDDETCTFGYTTVTNGIEDSVGNDLGSIVGGAVTNSSTHTPTEVSYIVTPSTGTGCAVSPVTAKMVITGNTTTFTCASDRNYQCISWTGICGGTGTTTLTTSAITADCTVIQPCQKKSPDVTIGSGATISIGSGSSATLY